MNTIVNWITKWSLLTPHKTALICNDRPYTYREVNERTNRLCHLFLGVGVKNGDRVAVLLRNRHHYQN